MTDNLKASELKDTDAELVSVLPVADLGDDFMNRMNNAFRGNISTNANMPNEPLDASAEQTEEATEEKSEQEKSLNTQKPAMQEQQPVQEQNELAKAEEKSEQEKSLNAQKPAEKEQQILEPVNQNTATMLKMGEQEEKKENSEKEENTNAQEPVMQEQQPMQEQNEPAKAEEKSESEKSASAEAQLLSGQNEPVEVKKPAEQLQFDPSQMISLENEQISLINSCIHALDREVRTLQDENEELLIKNNNQLVVFRLIYNEEQKRMLRLRQTIDGLKKYRENHNIETDGHTQFVNKIKNNYGFGFIQPKNATQCGAIQSQLIYSDDEERKRKERRELALTTYKALVDLNKETNRGLLQ